MHQWPTFFSRLSACRWNRGAGQLCRDCWELSRGKFQLPQCPVRKIWRGSPGRFRWLLCQRGWDHCVLRRKPWCQLYKRVQRCLCRRRAQVEPCFTVSYRALPPKGKKLQVRDELLKLSSKISQPNNYTMKYPNEFNNEIMKHQPRNHFCLPKTHWIKNQISQIFSGHKRPEKMPLV